MTSPHEDLGYVHAPAPKKPPPRAKVGESNETGDPVFGPWAAIVTRPSGKQTEVYGKSEGEAEDKAHEYARRVNR